MDTNNLERVNDEDLEEIKAEIGDGQHEGHIDHEKYFIKWELKVVITER